MSDDLVQRLRNWEAGAAMRPTLYDEAADRIEALEAEVAVLRCCINQHHIDTPPPEET